MSSLIALRGNLFPDRWARRIIQNILNDIITHPFINNTLPCNYDPKELANKCNDELVNLVSNPAARESWKSRVRWIRNTAHNHASHLSKVIKLAGRYARREQMPLYLTGRDTLPIMALATLYGIPHRYETILNRSTVSIFSHDAPVINKVIFLDTGFSGSIYHCLVKAKKITNSKIFLLSVDGVTVRQLLDNPTIHEPTKKIHAIQIGQLSRNEVTGIEEEVPKLHSATGLIHTTSVPVAYEYLIGIKQFFNNTPPEAPSVTIPTKGKTIDELHQVLTSWGLNPDEDIPF